MSQEGSAVVEAVLVIPVAMLLLLAVVQFALWANAAQVVQLAASEGDRAARTSGGNVAVGEARAEAVLSASGSGMTRISALVSLNPGGEAVTTVSARAVSILPWLVLPVSATQVGPVQEFRASG
jgi:Flp pilus assembly protein TadG